MGKIIGSVNLNPPMENKLKNPLKNGETVKRLKKMHERNLGHAGLRNPRSPVK